ncbi:type II secretion system F family protein [Eubacteriaceae bacterium ES3]|nr:type II secretion system F family protein [Eubacteriaceae bacterium ES3]
MLWLSINIGLLLFIAIIILFYRKAQEADTKGRRLNAIKTGDGNWDEEFQKPFIQRVIVPVYTSVIKTISGFLSRKDSNNNVKMEYQLRLAGLYLTVAEYNAIRIVIFGVLFLSAILFTILSHANPVLKLLIMIMSSLIPLAAPLLFLRYRINKRQTAISNELPDVMDLLCVTMEAGLGFDAALIKISDRLSGVLVNELNIVHTEINFGKPRRDALKSLADRNSVEELKTFAGSVIQADQLGIPVNQVLKAQSEELRIKRKQRAEEKAMKAPVKMMIPLVLFVLPVLFIVLLGPTILHLVEQFG